MATMNSAKGRGLLRSTPPKVSARRCSSGGIAIDAAGDLLAWPPKFNTPFGILDSTAAGGNLYALGDFTRVNGVSTPPTSHASRCRSRGWSVP